MTASRTARERARAELTREIKDEARRSLAESGAAGLSLRAVARQLGMVSSALYRYFPSRDDLLTALIIDAYNALCDQIEAAQAGSGKQFRARFHVFCAAVREWAVKHPNEYALIYGSPVPGYRAPEDTVGPGTRAPLALLAVLGEAWSAGALAPVADDLSGTLTDQLLALSEFAGSPLPGNNLARAVMAWTQLLGVVSFEVFGQLDNSLDPADAFFDFTVERMADFLGLAADTPVVGAEH